MAACVPACVASCSRAPRAPAPARQSPAPKARGPLAPAPGSGRCHMGPGILRKRIWTLTRTLGFPSCTPASHTRPWHGSPLNSRGHARYHLKCPPRVLFQVSGRTRSKSGHFLLPLFGSQGAHFPKCFSLCALTSPLQAVLPGCRRRRLPSSLSASPAPGSALPTALNSSLESDGRRMRGLKLRATLLPRAGSEV